MERDYAFNEEKSPEEVRQALLAAASTVHMPTDE